MQASVIHRLQAISCLRSLGEHRFRYEFGAELTPTLATAHQHPLPFCCLSLSSSDGTPMSPYSPSPYFLLRLFVQEHLLSHVWLFLFRFLKPLIPPYHRHVSKLRSSPLVHSLMFISSQLVFIQKIDGIESILITDTYKSYSTYP